MKPFGFLLMLLSATVLHAQKAPAATNYLGTDNTIRFGKKDYNLAWSSHPITGYYKQEYLTDGDSLHRFASMLLLEAATGATSAKQALAAKQAELNTLKKTNPLVQFEVFENPKTGDCLIDFLLTAPAPNGGLAIVERNVYRYKNFTDKKGAACVLLFGVSERGYGNGAPPFLAKLKKEKSVLRNEVAAMTLPATRL